MGSRMLTYELSGSGRSRTLTAHLYVSYYFAHRGDWTGSQPGRWKQRFRAHAEATWSRRWELYRDDDNVQVDVRVHEVTPGSVAPNQHWWIAVNSPARPFDEWITRTIYRYRGPLPHSSDLESVGSGLVKLHHDDIECLGEGQRVRRASGTDSPPGELTSQRGTDHEVGHMLGMQHPYCNGGHVDEGDPQSASCYWRPGQTYGRSPLSYSIMGAGNRVFEQDYAWAKNLLRQVEGREYALRQKTTMGAATCG